MKVPKNQPPPRGSSQSSHTSQASEKDKTLTRRTVKGAAGGMKGVDYEEEHGHDPTRSAQAQGASRAKAGTREAKLHEREIPIAEGAYPSKPTGPLEADTPLYEPGDAISEEVKRRQRRRHVARDRLSVDKDAPEHVRDRRWDPGDESGDERERGHRDAPDESLYLDAVDFAATPLGEARGPRFRTDSRPIPGDLSLTDPDRIQQAFGSPLDYARHVMILAEAFRRATGASREEAIDYLARMFVGLTDRSFGRLALKEFGPDSGIIEIYPLEVIERVLLAYPGFLSKVGFGRLVRNAPETEPNVLLTDTMTPIFLEYAHDLKIRGFAIAGGGRPGYVLEPDVEPGRYKLEIHSPGRFSILISALNRSGHTTIERLAVHVRPRTVSDLTSCSKGAIAYPERDEERVRAWPMPSAKPFDCRETLDDEVPRSEGAPVMSHGEIVRRQQLDALRGPQPSGRPVEVGGRPHRLDLPVGLSDEDARLLREAVREVLARADSMPNAQLEADRTPIEPREIDSETDADPEPAVESGTPRGNDREPR